MCGNFNGDDFDDLKTPESGDLQEVSAKVFGDSWKVDQQCNDKVNNKEKVRIFDVLCCDARKVLFSSRKVSFSC